MKNIRESFKKKIVNDDITIETLKNGCLYKGVMIDG